MTSSVDINSLLAEYPSASEYRKAEIEEHLWLSRPDKNNVSRRDYIHSLTHVPTRHVEIRSLFFHAPQEVQSELWRLLDKEQESLYSIYRLLSEARSYSKEHKCSLVSAFNNVYSSYKNASHIAVNHVTGRSYRRRSSIFSEENLVSGKNTSEKCFSSGGSASFENQSLVSSPVGESYSFWVNIRKTIMEEMTKRMEGVDPVVVAQMSNSLESELHSVVDSFQQKIYRCRKRELGGEGSTTVNTISRRELIHACRTLHMDPPPQGKPLDMKFVKKQKHKLVRLYHPDQHRGDESARPRYEEVIKAFDILSEYMNRNFPNGN